MQTLIRFTAGFVFIALVTSPQWAYADAGRIVTGADASAGGPHVKAFTPRTLTNVASFFPYAAAFGGGVRVATGDVNGDGAPDIITGSGPGAVAQVIAFSGRDQTELRNFFPYGTGYAGGVFVAAGDVNGDGFDDIVTGTDDGVDTLVKVFNGQTGEEVDSFGPYETGFSGGVRVATGDINNDGTPDIITGAGPGGGPHVKVFDGTSHAEIGSFDAYNTAFTGGVNVASGDVNGDGFDDIITGAGPGGGPHVKVFDGSTQQQAGEFFPYAAQFTGGVRVASGDLNGDGLAEIITSPGSGGAPVVRVFSGTKLTETTNFLAYPAGFTNGVFLSVASVKHPRLDFGLSPTQEGIMLKWPSGCLCELESTTNSPIDPEGWDPMDVRPMEDETTVGLLLPAIQKVRYYRLNCDDEAIRGRGTN